VLKSDDEILREVPPHIELSCRQPEMLHKMVAEHRRGH